MKMKPLKLALVPIVCALAGYFMFSQSPQAEEAHAGGMPQAMPISVAVVEQKELTEWREFSGRLRAVEDVDIRPRVSGMIDAVHFNEGDIVQKDTPLFTIDPRPFQAALASAEADLASAKAQANMAYSDYKRGKNLLKEKAVSQREYDEKNNSNSAAAAAVKSAEARRDLAALDLEYAQVKAPITGRVGRIDITIGNMVQAGASALTTMQSTTPIYADFDVDEQTYLRLMKSVRVDGRAADMPVYMALADETIFTRSGKIKAFDNQMMGSSGTLRARAEFDNTDGLLTPGLFTRVRLGSAEKSSKIVINDAAIGTDQSKRFVYVVDAEGNVGYRPVVLGSVGPQGRAIVEGLTAGEKIIVNGLMRVHQGMKVAPMMVSMDTLQPLSPPPPAEESSAERPVEVLPAQE